ncbi:nascent polypeptide-associated complex subunit alpha, muscle-specific form-like [Zingiber officinale]|uniref:Calmodulin-binding domain-containing protein n=1 Tax=Zingiber officinale TaxID=94328 RepID=A0A8J5GB40_ZINOF|nr:nascent polypeptide-associated complex subunit alpha, muscle-specific form-like [Zingiber officinale]KAG6495917.1 hypothetical protein ZIOFF_043748 [Zingiber officinale]
MASSRASTHMKEKTTPTHIGPEDPRRQRTTKTSVPSSPERDTAPQQSRPLNRSSSDGAKSTPPQQTSSASAKSRLTASARKPGEKPPSPSRQPLKSSPATSGAVREKTAKPSASAASRPATKPGISSDKATKTLKTGVKGRSSPSRGAVASRRPKESSASADDAARITTKSVEPVVTENTVVTENNNQTEEQDSVSIASMDIDFLDEHHDDICDENPMEVEETMKEIDDDHIEEKDQVSECEEHHESPKHDPDGICYPHGSRVGESDNEELSDEPPAEAEESHKSPMAEPSKEFNIHEKIEDVADETSLNNSPAAETSTEKIKVETKKFTAPAAPFSKPAPVQEKKKEAPVSNEVIEETRSKLLEKKKSKVSALVGAFETVISLQDDEGQPGQSQKST